MPYRLTVEPLKGFKATDGLLLISFEESKAKAPSKPEPARTRRRAQPGEQSLVAQLESELRATREDLQSTIEELETANEELKASNEEIMSINEELQSTNEELETSKEELQSLNEELSTVNNQLEGKVAELESLNDDLSNLLVSTDLATLFLDTRLRVRRFTPAMTRLLPVIASDVGRPVADFGLPLVSVDLIQSAQFVLEKLTPVESEVRIDEHYYARRILPYRTEDNRIDGVVITFQDVTMRRRAEEATQRFNEELEARVAQRTAELSVTNNQLERTKDYLQAIILNAGDGFIIVDDRGIVESINPATERLLGYQKKEMIGRDIGLFLSSEAGGISVNNDDAGQARMMGVGRDVVGKRNDGFTVPIEMSVGEMRNQGICRFICNLRDLTERRRNESELRQLIVKLAELSAKEQRRIGQELHDQIGQVLSGTAMLARSLEQKLAAQKSKETAAAGKLVEQIRDAYAQVRDLAKGLAPVMTARHGLGTALAEFAERIGSIYNISCEYRGDHDITIENIEAAEHLYRIVQEAVSNAVRHGRSKRIQIGMEKESDDALAITVKDDGDGLPADYVRTDGIGLRIMNYRAQLIGGTLDIRTAEGGGTVVRCVVPAGQDAKP